MPRVGTQQLGSSKLGPSIGNSRRLGQSGLGNSQLGLDEVTTERIGNSQLGGERLGLRTAAENVKAITLGANSSSTLTHDINAIFTLSQTATSTSALSHNINGIFTLDYSSVSSSTLSQTITRVLDITLPAGENTQIGEAQLGNGDLGNVAGKPGDFKSNSNASFGQVRIQQLSLTASSDSTLSLGVFFIEQYGRDRGNAEVDTIARGSAKRDTIVQGNAEIDIIVVGNAEVD